MTAKHNMDFCKPYSSTLDILSTTVPYMVDVALNVPMSIITVFANFMVLLAIRCSTSIHLPSKILLSSLVLTDLGVGLFGQPQFVMFTIIRARKAYSNTTCFLVNSYIITASVFSSVSIFSMTAISVDRYVALFHHQRYREIVTVRRVLVVVTIMWSSTLAFATSWLWNKSLWIFSVCSSVCVCFIVNSVTLVKIYRELRVRYGQRIQDQTQEVRSTVNVAKYRRSTSTILWIYVLFILCYSPFLCLFIIFQITMLPQRPLAVCIYEFSITVVHLNSCLNPFVYSLRQPEIRAEVLKQLRKRCGQNPSQ